MSRENTHYNIQNLPAAVMVTALMEAFERVMKRLPKKNRYLVEDETIGVEDRVEELIKFFVLAKKHSSQHS